MTTAPFPLGFWEPLGHFSTVMQANQPTRPAKLTQAEFWALPEVVEQQEIQKNTPYGRPEHRAAFDRIKQLLAEQMGAEFAEEHMGSYD